MTSRYILSESPAALGDHYGVSIEDNFPPRYNIAPSQPVPVIVAQSGRPAYRLVRWGFVPGWDRRGTWFSKAVVNIRAETVEEKKSFQHAWRRRRCLFPTNGFYLWHQERGMSQPYFLTIDEDRPLFSIAGIWEDWMGIDGSEMTTAGMLTWESVSPLTGEMSRQPLLIRHEDYAPWLNSPETDLAEPKRIISTANLDVIFWRVSTLVNDWRSDGEHLISEV